MCLLLIYGVSNALNAYKIWEIFQSWKSQTTPAKPYFVVKRIEGIIIVLFAIFMLIRPLIEKYIYMHQM